MKAGLVARFCFTVVVLALIPVALFGQVTKGSISGTVVDQSGAVISGAALKATDIQTGAVFQAVSDRSGGFRFSLIPPGTYKVEVSKSGFGTKILQGVVVATSQDAGLGTVALAISSSSQTVEVSANATPLLETTQAQITNTFSTQQLLQFTNINENEGLDNLALLVPGVNATRDLGYSNTNGPGISSDGTRGRSNDQQIDGQNNNDNSVTGPALQVSDPEFVSEYQIITNNFGPQYGRNGGSVINVVTKSGTNRVHGSVYGYWTNSDLQALSSYQKSYESLTEQPRSNTEFGGFTFGFPIVKNRLFFFNGFDEQLWHESEVYTSGSVSPTPTGLTEAGACSDANALDALEKYGPWGITTGNPTIYGATSNVTVTNASGASCSVQVAQVQRAVPERSHEFNWLPRLDYSNGKDTFVARYLLERNDYFDIPDNGAGGWFYNEPDLSQATELGWTRAFTENMVNQLSLDFSRENVQFGGSSNDSDPSTANIKEGVANIGTGTGNLGYGPADNLPQGRIVNTWQVEDNFNYQLGKHDLIAGVNWTYQRSPNVFLPNVNGTLDFNSWADYLTNDPSQVNVANGIDTLDFREKDTFLYGGDNWQLKPNLTLNLGLTWSFYGQPANLFHQIDTAQQSGSNPLWNPSLPLADTTFPELPSHYNLWGPGIGFAWTPGFLGSVHKTVLRGGYRLAYDPPFYNIYLNIAEAAPQVLAQSLSNSSGQLNGILPANPVGPNVRAALAPYLVYGVQDPRQDTEITVSNNFNADNVSSWSFGIQHQIRNQLVAEARYVGNHGGNQFQTVNANPYLAGLEANFPSQIPSGTPISSVNGREDGTHYLLRARTNTGYSNYDSLQTELRGNDLFHQLVMTASYTWSKTLDNASEIFSNGAAGVTSALSQNPLNYTSEEYGLSGIDIPQNFTLNFAEQLPFLRGQHGLAGHIFGGWNLAGSYFLASGQPYTPIQYYFDYIASGAYANPALGVTDYTFNGAYGAGYDDLRPFLGSNSAPASQVGVYAGDACNYFGGASCSVPANTLISFNHANATGDATTQDVTRQDVRYIMNGPDSEAAYGTPWGNVARNFGRDAWTNYGDMMVSKTIKLREEMNATLRADFNDVFNHPNYSSVDPYLEDAGYNAAYTGFGLPQVTSSSSRLIQFSARIAW